MRLKKEQIEELLSLIAEGLLSDEINIRAGLFDPPFDVSKTQVSYYRRTRHQKITELKEAYENNALNIGLARKCIRVQKLQKLAELMEKDLFEKDLLWIEKSKIVGSGQYAEIEYYDEFNKAEVDAYRGVLDDLAKETGGRAITSIEKNIDLDKLNAEQLERLAAGHDIFEVLAG